MRKAFNLEADGSAASRGAAVRWGLVRYNTGKACRRGHFAERYSSTGACVECVAARGVFENAKLQEASELLRWGKLDKDKAEELGSPWYCLSEQLPCGHIAHQRVADDACRMCFEDERAEAAAISKEQLDLVEQLLS
jgi:hypothetical protein